MLDVPNVATCYATLTRAAGCAGAVISRNDAGLIPTPERNMTTTTINITGYFEGGCCGHCGRELRYCVQTDAGTFGAACFSKTITKPRTYRGKSYRLSTDAVISLAKTARRDMAR